MQPPSVMFGHHFGTQAKAGFSSFPIVRKFGPESFNFKDLSMKTGHADYFTANPHRGSSPTVSLAADLSQNFHIDRSPQLVTPRRSLFTASLLGPDNGRGLSIRYNDDAPDAALIACSWVGDHGNVSFASQDTLLP
ncbi:m-phase inducer phosphatase [Ophidiomyces ophidiicola]|nr:m-phase inducer phosphatase [Ophidiomyces ophidiicola]